MEVLVSRRNLVGDDIRAELGDQRAAVVRGDVHGKLVVVIVRKGMERHAELLKIAHAVDALGLEFGFAERGQKQPGEKGDDGDDE